MLFRSQNNIHQREQESPDGQTTNLLWVNKPGLKIQRNNTWYIGNVYILCWNRVYDFVYFWTPIFFLLIFTLWYCQQNVILNSLTQKFNAIHCQSMPISPLESMPMKWMQSHLALNTMTKILNCSELVKS